MSLLGATRISTLSQRPAGAVDLLASPLVLDLRHSADTQRAHKEQAGAASALLGQSGVSLGLRDAVSSTCSALFLEVVANALTHSAGNWASAAFGVLNEPEPRLEFAVADDGIGIGAAMSRRFGLWGVHRIPERAWLAALFTDADVDGRRGILGRGATLLMREIVSLAPGAEINIRSGGASLHLGENLLRPGIAASASHGLGTVITCSVPLARRA